MITRRCSQRTFRLRPSDRTNEIMEFCFALAAQRSGVEINAICVMSNHHHALVRDVEGRVCDFIRELHRLTAKCLNASQGQWETLWSNERAHLLELGDEHDLVARVGYLAANPVEAGLVATPEEWPGVMRLPKEEPYVVRVKRPIDFFGPNSSVPEELELRITPPAIDNLKARVEAAIDERVARVHARMKAEGWRFLGRAGVLATSFVKRARSFEKKRKLVPVIAAQSREIRRRLREARREFTRAYYEALAKWRSGERGVEFPYGTWWMRVFHGAAVAQATTPN